MWNIKELGHLHCTEAAGECGHSFMCHNCVLFVLTEDYPLNDIGIAKLPAQGPALTQAVVRREDRGAVSNSAKKESWYECKRCVEVSPLRRLQTWPVPAGASF